MKIIDATKDDIDDNPDMKRLSRTVGELTRRSAIGFSVAFGALFGLLMSSTAADRPAESPRWTITHLDERYRVDDTPLYWLDGDRLIFSGSLDGHVVAASNTGGFGGKPRQLFAWKIGGAIVPQATYVADYCYSGGHSLRITGMELTTFLSDLGDLATGKMRGLGEFLMALPFGGDSDKRGPRYYYLQGKLGREKSDSRHIRDAIVFEDRLRFREADCSLVDRPKDFGEIGNISWIPLMPGDGVLTFEYRVWDKVTRPNPPYISWFRPGAPKATRLDLAFDQKFSIFPNVEFYPFKDAYFLWQYAAFSAFTDGRLKDGTCFYTHWLHRNGDWKTVCVPFGAWSPGPRGGDDASLIPVRDGILVVRQRWGDKRPGANGVFLIAKGRIERVLDGFVGQPRKYHELGTFVKIPYDGIRGSPVSPDGCRAAFLHSTNSDVYRGQVGSPAVRHLAVVDFCPARR